MTPLALDRLDGVLALNNAHAAELSLSDAPHVAGPTCQASGSDDALPAAQPEPQVGIGYEIRTQKERDHAARMQA